MRNEFTFCILLLILCHVTALHRTIKKPPTFRRCDQLPKAHTDFSLVIEKSPFYVYRSNDPSYNCSTGIGTGPRNDDSTYKGTYIIVQGLNVKTEFSVQSVPENDTSVTTYCNSGVSEAYRFLVFNLTKSHSYICVYICSEDGISVTTFRCYGRNSKDEFHIQKAIKRYMTHIPGADKIIDTQKDCPPNPFCPFFLF